MQGPWPPWTYLLKNSDHRHHPLIPSALEEYYDVLVSKGITAPTHLTTKLTMADVETVRLGPRVLPLATPSSPPYTRRRMTASPKVPSMITPT